MDVWLSRLAALLPLNDSERYSCSPSNTSRILLLTAWSAEAQKRPKDFVPGERQSPGYFFTALDDDSTQLYAILKSCTYMACQSDRKSSCGRRLP